MSIDSAIAELRELARPGLPVIQRPIDNTAMSAFSRCPREYFFSMFQHRRSGRLSPSLAFGRIWHKILETHYRTDGDKHAVVAAALDHWEEPYQPDPAKPDYRSLERSVIEYDKYVSQYGLPLKEVGKTVFFHGQPLIELPASALAGELIHPWAVKIDRVIEIDGLYWIEDHKTTSRFDKHYFSQYLLSNQMMGYAYQAQHLLPDIKIQGVRINLLHVLTSTSNFKREPIPFSREKLQHWARNTNAWIRRLASAQEAYNSLLEEGMTIDEARDLAFPGHFGDDGCSRKFGLCGYFEVCSASPLLRSKMLTRNFPEQHPWNPLNIDGDDD